MDRSMRLASSFRRAVLRTVAADFRLRDWWAEPNLFGWPLSIRSSQTGSAEHLRPGVVKIDAALPLSPYPALGASALLGDTGDTAAGLSPLEIFSKRCELRLIIDFLFCLSPRRARSPWDGEGPLGRPEVWRPTARLSNGSLTPFSR